MINFSVEKIIQVLKAKKYAVFENDAKPYNLNLIGIRSKNNVPDSFDDTMNVFWKYKGVWILRTFPCTTDPGLYYLNNPMNSLGTGILKEGQYRGCWQIGLHQGKYKALVQRKDVTCIRDFDRDNMLDFSQPNLSVLTKKEKGDKDRTVEWYDKDGKLIWREQTGLFGMNGHRANENGKTVVVGKYSAMCQVLQNKQIVNPDNVHAKVFEFDYFMGLCDKQVANGHGESFSYTLLNEKDFENQASENVNG